MNKKQIVSILILIVVVFVIFSIVNKAENKEVEINEDNQVENVEEVEGNLEAEKIIGRWQSVQDLNAEVVFGDDGTTSDIYKGEKLSLGSYEIYEDENSEYNSDGKFLRVNIEEEVYEYAILEVNSEKLIINYLARGNTLEYKAIK